jgi:HSP20 family protein
LIPAELDELFEQTFGGLNESRSSAPFPRLDLYEDKESLVVQVELPGMKKEEIGISLEDGLLTISGERKATPLPETATVTHRELASGRFDRRVRLPYQVENGKIKATYTDGMLTVTLPKAEEAKPKLIQIDAQ